MSKRAVELSMTTIIVAAIALIVLVVIVIIFTGQSGKFRRGLDDCSARGGDKCTQTGPLCVADGGIPAGNCVFYDDKTGEKTTASREGWVCCVTK